MMTRHLNSMALAAAGAILSLMLAGGVAFAQDIPEDLPISGDHDFITWLMSPMDATMLTLIAACIAGAVAAGGLMFLKYHVFKVSFERLGHLLLYMMPLVAVCAVAGTLVLRKYNLFLLSLYLDIPLIGAPILYLLYNRLLVEKSDRQKL
jgi:hypothetical protein